MDTNQIRRHVEVWRSFSTSLNQSNTELLLVKWAGSLLSPMKRSWKVTCMHLRHSDPYVRLSALLLVSDYWPLNHNFIPELQHLLYSETDERVHGLAFLCLLPYVTTVTDQVIKPLLAEFLTAESTGGLCCHEDATSQHNSPVLTDIDADAWAFLNKHWKGLAGQHLEAMMRSTAEAEAYLENPSPQLRCAALSVLQNHWKPGRPFADRCERTLSEDQSPEVVRYALSCLARYYGKTDNPRIGRLIAGIIYQEAKPLELRSLAYQALHQIRGMPVTSWPTVLEAEGHFRFPEDVDWGFVESF